MNHCFVKINNHEKFQELRNLYKNGLQALSVRKWDQQLSFLAKSLTNRQIRRDRILLLEVKSRPLFQVTNKPKRYLHLII